MNNYAREFSSEFVINNLPTDQRELLLLKDTRKSVCETADVDISIRGRYVKPKSDGTLICEGNVKPLYLNIVSKSKHNLTLAMKKIQQILKHSAVDSPPKTDGSSEDDTYDDILEEKITIGIDIFPAHFRMKSKILGENEEFVKYIEKETGARITLRGKGSNYENDNKFDEPLHIHVIYNNPRTKARTRQLVLNLVDTVQKDFVEHYAKFYSLPKKPEIIPLPNVQKSPNQSLIAERKIEHVESRVKNDIDKIMVGFDYAPQNFNLKSRIYGPNCSHVEHIENEAGALLLLQGRGCRFPDKDETDEPPHLLVKYRKPELIERARDLIFNLLETVHQDFIKLYGTYPIKPQKPRIVLYDPNSEKKSMSPSRKSDFLRRSKTPPKSSRHSTSLLTTGSSLRQDRSPKAVNVIPPPPPVISKPFSPNIYESNEVPLMMASSVSMKPVPPPSNFESAPSDRIFGYELTHSSNTFHPKLNSNMKNHTISETITNRLPFTSPSNFMTPQYNKKRSYSPESTTKNFHENKKFCNLFPVSTDVRDMRSVPPKSIASREQNSQKGKSAPNRCLVPVLVKRNETSTPAVSSKTHMPFNNKSPVNGHEFKSERKHDFNSLNNRNKEVTASKNSGAHSLYNFYDNLSDSEDNQSVICIDSEEECHHANTITSVAFNKKPNVRSVRVQTNEDEVLKNKKIYCICGKFTHFVTSVRSCGVQTDHYYKC